MFNFLKSLFQKKYPTGFIADPRTTDVKSLDYIHEELVGVPAPMYKTGFTNLNQYPDENQLQTSSCVAHATTLAFTKGSPRLSKMFLYRSRMNYPAQGMWLQNAGDILKNIGSCLYASLPNIQTEAMANSLYLTTAETNEAATNKTGNYVQFKIPNDIDKIASLVSQGTPVAIIIYATYREWAQQYPSLIDNPNFDTAPIRHCICAVDSLINNGIKYLKIQDSAQFGGFTFRYLSEAFITARCYGAMYFTKLQPAPILIKPDHLFEMDLQFGQTGSEVVILQKRLMFEGTFPAAQPTTGYFGGITIKAVKDYQTAHGIPSTGFVGPITRNTLNGG